MAQSNAQDSAAAKRLALQATDTADGSLITTRAVTEKSVVVRAVKSTSANPSSIAKVTTKYTEKGGEKTAVAVKDASKATADPVIK